MDALNPLRHKARIGRTSKRPSPFEQTGLNTQVCSKFSDSYRPRDDENVPYVSFRCGEDYEVNVCFALVTFSK